MRTEDIIADAGAELEYLIAAYWRLSEIYDRTVTCDNPECEHSKADKESITNWCNAQAAQLLREFVTTIENAL